MFLVVEAMFHHTVRGSSALRWISSSCIWEIRKKDVKKKQWKLKNCYNKQRRASKKASGKTM
jgi:hypothetical protein